MSYDTEFVLEVQRAPSGSTADDRRDVLDVDAHGAVIDRCNDRFSVSAAVRHSDVLEDQIPILPFRLRNQYADLARSLADSCACCLPDPEDVSRHA